MVPLTHLYSSSPENELYPLTQCNSPPFHACDQDQINVESVCELDMEGVDEAESNLGTATDPEPVSYERESDAQCGLDSPLYGNAPVTLYATLLLILAFSISHKLTKDALSDLLSLLNVIILKPHSLPTSLYKFYSTLKLNKAASIRHYYCSLCEQLLDSNSSSKCPNPLCGQTPKDPPYFLELSLEDQLRKLFERPSFYQHLQHRFNRNKLNTDIEDIYDGKLYRDLSKPNGILSFRENISLLWNTDGIPVFKSSNFSIWPVYFIITL